MRDLIIAVDIGATKILGGIVTREGRVVERIKEPTLANRPVSQVIDHIVGMVERLINIGARPQDIAAVAVAAPGPLDHINGTVVDSPNLCWENVSLRDELSKRLDYKVLLGKDTNMAVLGEWYFGSSQGCRHLLYITISTGIGGGLIINGQLYYGQNGGAGEVGHLQVEPRGVKCGCGRNGCLEALASGTAIACQARDLINQGRGQAIARLSTPGQPVTAREVAAAARQGDKEAREIVARTAEYLGAGISSLVNILNPERVILGGGVVFGWGDLLLMPVSAYVNQQIFRLHSRDLYIGITPLGEDIGLLGCTAAVLLDLE